MSQTFPQPVLLIGSTGMLGVAWRHVLDQMQVPYHCPTRTELDLADSQSIEQILTDNIQLVINCAAYTAVDDAEQEELLATCVNGEGVGKLACCCKQVGAKLVHYSTDYVFPGKASSPYLPDMPRNPCNAYGRSKAVGEKLIEQSGCDYLILRTSWLYAPWANNFVITIANIAALRDELQVVNDQVGRPTSTQHLALATAKMIQAQAQGTHHITDGGQCSWFDFATEIVRITGAPCTVKPCGSDQYPRPAMRPVYSVLDLSSTENIIGLMPNWKKNLASVMEQLRKKEIVSP